jgi:hypothetical protein
MTVRIEGYLEQFEDDPSDVLVDGWLGDATRASVAAHIISGEIDEELVFEVLGVSEEDALAAFRRLRDRSAWPVFRVPLPEGNFLTCVYRNWDESSSIDYLLEFGDGSPAALLAATKWEQYGPGISWHELYRALYKGPASVAQSPDLQLLILIHMLGDGPAKAEAAEVLTRALRNVGGGDAASVKPEMLAQQILDMLTMSWGDPTWKLSPEGSLACGGFCPRNPSRDDGMDRETRIKVTRALGGPAS